MTYKNEFMYETLEKMIGIDTIERFVEHREELNNLFPESFDEINAAMNYLCQVRNKQYEIVKESIKEINEG